MKTPPILFLVFNRPGLTQRVFDAIREAKPSRLYIAADGPREERVDESEQCRQVRELVQHVNWDCTLHTRYQEKNLGCKLAVSSAIDWFFEHEEAGIILEDDCLPHPSFFPYCAELLDRYADSTNVMTISGSRLLPAKNPGKHSYAFNPYHHIWGWATWRRAWQQYQLDISDTSVVLHPTRLMRWLQSEESTAYWHQLALDYREQNIDTWDYPWLFSCFEQQGLSITPRENLISNIGFGQDATHTFDAGASVANLPTYPMKFPLHHPLRIRRNAEVEAQSLSCITRQPIPMPQNIAGKIGTFLKRHLAAGNETS